MEGSHELRALLLSSKCATKSATPAFVRTLFKHLAARTPAAGHPGGEAGANGTVSLRADNPQARKNCLLLLRYCLADLGGGGRTSGGGARRGIASRGKAQGSFRELAGLPLVPLADGSHGVFRSTGIVDAAKLAELRAMGFSEGRSRQALVKYKEVQPAVEWLFSGGGDEDGSVAEQPFVLCAQEEADLLAGAGKRLISEAALSSGDGGAASDSATPGMGRKEGDEGANSLPAADDDGRVIRALRSPSLQALLNVTSMRDELLPDLIGQTLPAEWRSGGSLNATSTTAFAWTPQRAGHPDVDWLRRLWGYLALTRPSAVRLLAESYPVVPTGEDAVCPLSLRSAVIDGTRLSQEVRAVLVRAGCRTLLPGVFSGGVDDAPSAAGAGGEPKDRVNPKGKECGAPAPRRQPPPPPPELFEYVRPGTRAGALAALGTARRSAGKEFRELLSAAGTEERDALRDFLAREPASEMSHVEVEVCRALPILPLHADGLTAAHALANVVMTAAAAGAVRTGKTKQSQPTPLATVDHSFAAANEGPLYLLVEAGNGLVGVSADRVGGNSAPSSIETAASEPKWLETHLFTSRFLKMGGANGSRQGAAESALAERLGAKLIGRAAFFVDHVFPRILSLPAGLRDAAMVEALLEAPRLSQQHQGFRSALEALAFVPAGTRVRPPCLPFVCRVVGSVDACVAR